MTDEASLVFYTNPMSRGRIARWMLGEAGAPYRTAYVRFGAPIVTECAAICTYLADAFPEARLAPAPADRADAAPHAAKPPADNAAQPGGASS